MLTTVRDSITYAFVTCEDIWDQINFVMAVASFAPGAVPTIGSLYFRCLYLKLSPACSGTGTQRHKVDVLTYETHKYYL